MFYWNDWYGHFLLNLINRKWLYQIISKVFCAEEFLVIVQVCKVIDNYLWETEDQGYVEIWLMLYSWSLLACSIFYIIFLLICSTWIPGIFFHSRCHFLRQRVFQICCLKDGQYQQLEVSNAFHRIHFPKTHILMFV